MKKCGQAFQIAWCPPHVSAVHRIAAHREESLKGGSMEARRQGPLPQLPPWRGVPPGVHPLLRFRPPPCVVRGERHAQQPLRHQKHLYTDSREDTPAVGAVSAVSSVLSAVSAVNSASASLALAPNKEAHSPRCACNCPAMRYGAVLLVVLPVAVVLYLR
jgi:hypothetical protein